VRAGPVRESAPPAYGTRREALADPALRGLAFPRRLFRHPGMTALGAVVASTACTPIICVVTQPPTYLNEAEALQVIDEVFERRHLPLEQPTSGDRFGLPFTPDRTSWRFEVAVELVFEGECEPILDAAATLLAEGDARCGVTNAGDTGDTGPEDSERELQEAWCADLVSDGVCRGQGATEAFARCLAYACSPLHWMGLAAEEWTRGPLVRASNDFINKVKAEDSP